MRRVGARRSSSNAAFDILKAAKVAPYTNPIVTVALRSDGSVDSIVINQSSGVADVDAAVRRIIQSLAPYAPFPRDLAAEFDVIEIRRVWSFDTAKFACLAPGADARAKAKALRRWPVSA